MASPHGMFWENQAAMLFAAYSHIGSTAAVIEDFDIKLSNRLEEDQQRPVRVHH